MAPPIVKRYLISLERNLWLGILTWISVSGISVLVAVQPPPVQRPSFRAIGQLAFRTPPPAFTSTGVEIQQQSRVLSLSTLLARPVLEKVRDRLKWTDQEIVEAIQTRQLNIIFPDDNKVNKSSDEETAPPSTTSPAQVITLEYTDYKSPSRATLVLESFMSEMIKYSRSLNTAQLTERIAALKERLGITQKDLTQAEEKFYRFITKDGSDLLAVQDGSLFAGITSSQQDQRELKLVLKDIEGQISSLTQQLGLNPKEAYTSSALSADPIIGNLRVRILDNELQLERLKYDLRPEHPTIVKLEKDKKVNEELLQQRAEEVIGKDGVLVPLPADIRKDSNLDPARQQLANQLVGLQVQREGITQQLASVIKTEQELKQQYERFPTKQLQQARLVQAVEFQRTIYQNILTALVDAQSSEAEAVSSLTVTQKAEIVPNLTRSKKGLDKVIVIAAGTTLGLILGAGVIFLLSLADNRLHSPIEIQEILTTLEITILAQIPWFYSPEKDPIIVNLDSLELAFYERLRSKLRQIKSDSSMIILITSVEEEEGKSVTAYNLAIAAAHAGKRTLLVEADLRSSESLAHSVGINSDLKNTLEPLRYYSNRNDSIILAPAIENLSVLPSPGSQRQSAAILESSELELLLKDARGRFDIVIIDTPSLSVCNDALLLEPLTDGILLITRPGISRSNRLTEAIDQIVEAELPILGAVINAIEEMTITPTRLGKDGRTSQPFSSTEEERTQEKSQIEV